MRAIPKSGSLPQKGDKPDIPSDLNKDQGATVRAETPSRLGSSVRARFDTSSTTIGLASVEPKVWSKEPHVTSLPPLPSSNKTAKQNRANAFLIILKRLLPCVISVFVGAIFVVNKHIAFLSGTAEFAFLIIVIYTLFFHPAQHTVEKHVQVTAIGICGAVIGIGWSALGNYLACLSNSKDNTPLDANSVGARAACAIFLGAIAFIAADLKSRFPRLATGCLLSVFAAIWLLAVTTTANQLSPAPFLGMLYAVLFAAGISLAVSLVVFPASSNKALARQLIGTLEVTSELLLATLHLFQADSRSLNTLKEHRELCERVAHLRQRLSIDIQSLRPYYEDARYGITFALFPLEQYEAFIDLSAKLQNILVSRMGFKLSDSHHDLEDSAAPDSESMSADDDKPAYLRTLVDELGQMNLLALHTIRTALANSSLLTPTTSSDWLSDSKSDAHTAVFAQLHEHFRIVELENLRHRLDEIIDTFRAGIVDALRSALHESTTNEQNTHKLFRSEAFRDCFFFTSLVELSNDIQDGLYLASRLPRPTDTSRRIWIPALSTLFETSKSLATFSANTEEDEAAQQQWARDTEKRKHEQHIPEETASRDRLPLAQASNRRLQARLCSLQCLSAFISARGLSLQKWWSSSRVYRLRIRLDDRIQSVQNSRHLKHAFKCAFGISLLTLPGHLPASNAGYRWFEDVRGPWIAISFLYCLQTSTAATYRDAIFRTLGTLFGAIYGLVGQKIAGTNPYALVAVMTFQALFTNYLIIFAPRYQGVGIVGQLTIPAILFVPYLGLNYDTAVELAFLRAQDIEIGIVSALLVNTFLWPYHARVQLITACAKATDRIIKLYLSMSRQVLQRNYRMTDETRQQYESLEEETRMILTRASNLCNLVHIETSLLPKPVKKYRKLIRNLNELLNLWSGLRAIRQHIPRKLTVLDVMPQRTELISSILIILHAISHSLHTHSPVPQFLPHPHLALEHLIAAIEGHIAGLSKATPSSDEDTEENSRANSTVPSMPEGGPETVSFSLPSQDCGPGLDSGKLGFSFAFALAENEAITQAVEILSDIIETCKDLYGVASFIQQEEVQHLGDFSSYIHTPVRTPTRSARQSLSGTER